jgi:hypothetical protein
MKRLCIVVALAIFALPADAQAYQCNNRHYVNSSEKLRNLITIWITSIFLFLLAAVPALAERRVALVIGNATYKNTAPLVNPTNDASDLAAELRTLGFEVILGNDLDRIRTEDALQRFARLARGADAALFYYSGHGMQFNGRNYLVPIDARLEDEISLRYEMTSTEDIREALQASQGVKIMILDACRNNPLANRLEQSIATSARAIPLVRGFSPIAADEGMLIEYATQPNRVAEDGTKRNSPFTSSLLEHLREPNVEIGTMFRRIGNDVYKATNGAQSPELSVSLHTDFFLNEGVAADVAPNSQPKIDPTPITPAPAATAVPSAALVPTKVASAPTIEPSDANAMAASINVELRRVGCYPGDLNANWTSEGVRRAVADVIRSAHLSVGPSAPSQEFLSFLRDQTGRLCPISCSSREMVRDGRCVAKTCSVDETLNAVGQCIMLPAPHSRTQPIAQKVFIAPHRAKQAAIRHTLSSEAERPAQASSATSDSASSPCGTRGGASSWFHDTWAQGLCK